MASAVASGFGDDELYFGSVPVHLVGVPGSVVAYQHDQWVPIETEASLAEVLARADPIGPDKDIVVPAIPALDFGLSEGASPPNPTEVGWPAFLAQPLIKVPEASEGEPKAFASGVRSCLVKLDGKWFRLKGSGNNDEKFIIKEATMGDGSITRTIRGCAWMHTSIRENHMVARLAASMEPQGILGANWAMGAYQYTEPNMPFGPELSVPACIVEGTRGDRRLGSHVLASLEIIMPMLVDAGSVDVAALKSMFIEPRQEENHDDPVVTTAQFMSDHMLGVEMAAAGVMAADCKGLSWDMPRDKTTMADGTGLELPLKPLNVDELPEQWTGDGPRPMADDWIPLWKQYASEYNALLESCPNSSKVLGYLFSRFGNDSGRILRAMHDVRISWGTYQDALCYDGQWHCNAHANNVTILDETVPPSAENPMFLGYLDLDMAFDDQTFVSIYGKGAPKGTIGTPTDEHDVLLARENVNFIEVLAGAEANNGVPSVAKRQVREQPGSIKVVKAVLYDTLVLGYLNAYNRDAETPLAQFDSQMHELSRVLIKISILIMADFIA